MEDRKLREMKQKSGLGGAAAGGAAGAAAADVSYNVHARLKQLTYQPPWAVDREFIYKQNWVLGSRSALNE